MRTSTGSGPPTSRPKPPPALSIAEANGKTEGMVKILELAAELTGYDWSYQG